MAAAIVGLFIALIHVYIFILESIRWGQPRTNKVFAVSESEAKTIKLYAFNQGFYNLFLAVEIVLGFVAKNFFAQESGLWLMDFGCGSVLAAGVVLYFSAKQVRRAAWIQAGPALLYLVLRFI